MQANIEGWQLKCLRLAEKKEPFAVEAFTERNLAFLEELCVAQGFKMKRSILRIEFVPENGGTSPRARMAVA